MANPTDVGQDRSLDGNAAAGVLQEIFAFEMTITPFQCGHCGLEAQVAELRAYAAAPGMVLRCPSCQGVVLRIVQTPRGTYLDASGASYLRFDT